MPDERHDRAPDDSQPTGYCTTKPLPGTYLTLGTLTAPCPDCGHATAVHIGVGHCPVCEMVDHNRRSAAIPDQIYARLLQRMADDYRSASLRQDGTACGQRR